MLRRTQPDSRALVLLKILARDPRTPLLSHGVRPPPPPFDGMEAHKRKRDDEGTLVTFYAPHRTFARVYKGTFSYKPASVIREISAFINVPTSWKSTGQSFDETKALVRQKLALADDASMRLARLHEGKLIELDDGEPCCACLRYRLVMDDLAQTTISKHSAISQNMLPPSTYPS